MRVGTAQPQLAMLDRAVEEFNARLLLVTSDEWTQSTPCPDWDVRYLVAHVVGGNRFAANVLGGMPAAEAMDLVLHGRVLGTEPVQDFQLSATTQRERFAWVDALTQTVSHPLGDMVGHRFLD